MKKVFAAVFFMAASFVIHAQSMESISQIVESPAINYGQAAYLALTYSGGIDEGATESEALYEACSDDHCALLSHHCDNLLPRTSPCMTSYHIVTYADKSIYTPG